DVRVGEDLAGRVTLEREENVVRPHPFPVIQDGDEIPPPRLERDLDRARARVDGVLHQLLESRGRPLDDLSGRDAAGDRIGEDDDTGHRRASYRKCAPAPETTTRERVMGTGRRSVVSLQEAS